MPTRSYTLYTSVLAIGSGVATLTLTDADDRLFEIPDQTGDNQSAIIDGSLVTINSISQALGAQLAIVLVDGIEIELSLTPTRIVVESGLIDTTYILYPELPIGATVISISLPLFPVSNVVLPLCLTSDALVRTPDGERKAGDLSEGDIVKTIDNGSQPIRWVGRRHVDFRREPELDGHRPVVIEAGALAEGLPNRTLRLSPQHAVMLSGYRAEILFGEEEVLVPARFLVGRNGVRIDEDCAEVDYCHLLLDRHEIIQAEGAEVESLFLGDLAANALCPETRDELRAIFPNLISGGAMHLRRARPLLKSFEARLLLAA